MAGTIGIDFFIGFGRALRAEGIQVGTAEFELFTKALPTASVKTLRDIYWVGRICLISSPVQIPIYDRVFQQWFQNSGDAEFPAALSLRHEKSVPDASHPRTLETLDKAGPDTGKAAAWSEAIGTAGYRRIDRHASDHELSEQLPAVAAQSTVSSWRKEGTAPSSANLADILPERRRTISTNPFSPHQQSTTARPSH
jgi:uncharacterized protein with von Willebrand factor type A (vWA) domain